MKKGILIILIVLMTFSSFGCAKKKVDNEKIKINMLVMNNDPYGRETQDILIKNFIDKYDFYELVLKENLTTDEIIRGINEGKIDVIFCNPKLMRDLEAEGLLSNLNNIYYKRNLFERTYSGTNTYGRIQNLFYGFPLYNSTFEIFYNLKELEKLNIDYKTTDLMTMLKICKENGVKIPIVNGEDDPNSYLLSQIMSNYVYLNNFDNYKDMLNEGFERIKGLYDMGIMNSDMFVSAGKEEMEKFKEGKYPFIVANSMYVKDFMNLEIGAWDNYKINDYWMRPLTYVDTLICFPVITNNEKGQKELIRFFTGNEFLKNLEEKNILTHDSNINRDFGGLNYFVTKHLENSSQNSMVYNKFLKSAFEKDLRELMGSVLSGEVTTEEMKEKLDIILNKRIY